MLEDELKERRLRNDEENRLMKHHHDMTRILEYKHMEVRFLFFRHFLKKKMNPDKNFRQFMKCG